MADRLNTGGKQLIEFGDLLKVNAKALRLEMRREIQPIRDRMTDEMKARADSPKIAATIKSGTRGTGNTVRVVFTAGAPGEPIARLRELGNKGSSGRADARAGLFRHPVFPSGPRSTWEWADQLMHPFMKPTVDANKDKVAPALGEAVKKTWRRSQPPEV